MHFLRPLFIALQLLTRIPIKNIDHISDKEMGYSILYYPFVGLAIGSFFYLILRITNVFDYPDLMAILLTVFWVLITGALHLDGLADSADAWLGGFGDRQRTLDIMKDPSCGVAGVTSIVLLLLLKFVTLSLLIQQKLPQLLVLIPLISRTHVLTLFLMTPYARQQGIAKILTDHQPKKSMMLIIVLIYSSIVWLLPNVWIPLIISLSILMWLRYLMIQRLGGMTGDTIGASIEISEVILLVLFVLLLS